MAVSFPLDIVMLNMNTMANWSTGVVNRNWFILNELEKRSEVNRILAVDFFPMTWRQAVRFYLNSIIPAWKQPQILYRDITTVCYQQSEKIIVCSTVASAFSLPKTMKKLQAIMAKLELKNPIVWSYNPLAIDGIDQLNAAAFVFDTVDKWSEHASYLAMMPREQIDLNYHIIAQKADCIFTVSESLVSFYQSIGRQERVTWIPNGVDCEHMTDPQKIAQSQPLAAITKPIIGYLGTIQDRLDFALIEKVANQFPDAVVALCGPIWDPVKQTVIDLQAKYANIMTPGRIPYNLTPSILHSFAVGIIPHKINEFIKSTNPMKLYDYLAAGIPVVTTEGEGVDMFQEYIAITKNPEEFVTAVASALQHNSSEKKQARQQVVKQHSWTARVNAMMQQLVPYLQQK